MSDYAELPEAKLRRLIDETEQTLAELKGEMERRDEAAQHAEIDRLDAHFRNAELSLASMRAFFRQVLAELRGETKV